MAEVDPPSALPFPGGSSWIGREELPLAVWPASDRQAWQRAITGGNNLLDDPGSASGWAPATRDKITGTYGRYLGWLEGRGDLDLDGPVGASLTPELVTAYLHEAIGQRAPLTILNRATDLRLFAKAVLPQNDWRWLAGLASALRRHCSRSDAKRTRVRTVDELVTLGRKLMVQHGGPGRLTLEQAVAYRDGFMIALLALRPLRLKNFTALTLGHSLLCQGRIWWIMVAGPETKTGQPIELPFPDALIPALERYLGEVRPILLRAVGRWARPPGQALWVSSDGSPMARDSIHQQVTRRTAEAFGMSVHPHLFRHCGVTSLALTGPKNVHLGAVMLGHRSLATTSRFYNLAQSIDASRSYNKVIESLRARSKR